MTDTARTQAAAQRCADLANAADHIAGDYTADFFNDDSFRSNVAFRREVEAKDAMIREVLALLGRDTIDPDAMGLAITKLRENLLPEPTPTLLEEFMAEYAGLTGTDTFIVGASAALDWIAKRQENEG